MPAATDLHAQARRSTKGPQTWWVAAGLLVLHTVVVLVLSAHVLTVAYAFSGDDSVTSLDELYRLGPGPRNAFAAAWIPLLTVPAVAWILLLLHVGRRLWILPLLGILLSVVLCLYFCTTFQPVDPLYK